MNRQSLKRPVKRAKLSKQSKHRNIKCEADGYKFDSKVERRYYLRLKQLKAAGEVLDFEMQKPFVLVDGFSKDGKKYQSIIYKADFFVTYADGEQVVIDVKGQPKVTADFAIKFKLFHTRYSHRFIIARYQGGTWVEKETLR